VFVRVAKQIIADVLLLRCPIQASKAAAAKLRLGINMHVPTTTLSNMSHSLLPASKVTTSFYRFTVCQTYKT